MGCIFGGRLTLYVVLPFSWDDSPCSSLAYLHLLINVSTMSQLPPGLDPWSVPYLAPPEGVTSNFHKRSHLLNSTIAIVSVLPPFIVFIVTLRVWAKFKSREPWKNDDCTFFIATENDSYQPNFNQGFTIATSAIIITQGSSIIPMTKRLGFHEWDIPLGFLMSPWFGKVRKLVDTISHQTNFHAT
jgi:hypothetical protein